MSGVVIFRPIWVNLLAGSKTVQCCNTRLEYSLKHFRSHALPEILEALLKLFLNHFGVLDGVLAPINHSAARIAFSVTPRTSDPVRTGTAQYPHGDLVRTGN